MSQFSVDKKPILFCPPSKEILEKVGLITINHGYLDYMLKMIVKDIEVISKREALEKYTYTGSKKLRKKIIALAIQRFGKCETINKLGTILTKAEMLTNKRNEYVHSIWAQELDGDSVISDKNHNWHNIPSIDELNKLADDIYALKNEIIDVRFGGFLEKALVGSQ